MDLISYQNLNVIKELISEMVHPVNGSSKN